MPGDRPRVRQRAGRRPALFIPRSGRVGGGRRAPVGSILPLRVSIAFPHRPAGARNARGAVMTLRCPDLRRILREREIDPEWLGPAALIPDDEIDRIVTGGPATLAQFIRIQAAINETPGPFVRLQLILGESTKRRPTWRKTSRLKVRPRRRSA